MVDSHHITEKKLVQQLIIGDFEAFDHLFRKYNKRLYYFAKSILKSNEDAKDVVQEVFLRVWKNRSSIDSNSSFNSFLFTIAYNIIVDAMRKRVSEQKFRNQIIKNAIKERSTVNEEMEYKELNSIYQKSIRELPSKRQLIYKMHRFENMTYKEIADKLNISVNTVRNQMTIAINFLKEKLGEDRFLNMLFIMLFV